MAKKKAARKKTTKKRAAKGRARTSSGKKKATAGKKAATRKTAKRGGGRKRYSEEQRREVAEYSIVHGIHAAAKKFGVSAPSVTNWRKAYGITRATKRKALSGHTVQLKAPAGRRSSGGRAGYPEELRREVADYSILHGIQAAAKKYKVSAPSVTNWRRQFGINRSTKAQALAAVDEVSTTTSLPKSEIRQVRRQLEQAFRAIDDLLSKL